MLKSEIVYNVTIALGLNRGSKATVPGIILYVISLNLEPRVTSGFLLRINFKPVTGSVHPVSSDIFYFIDKCS